LRRPGGHRLVELVTVSDPREVPDLTALDRIYKWTELIQSSPLAVERSVHAAIGGAYRSQRITTLELRFHPMKRNRSGERDLDHIITSRGVHVAGRTLTGCRRRDDERVGFVNTIRQQIPQIFAGTEFVHPTRRPVAAAKTTIGP
jgi:hypothetical protein